MKAWLLTRTFDLADEKEPLQWLDIDTPVARENEIVIKTLCCGVCHTELDEIEGRTAPPQYPVVPGHQVVGIVSGLGKGARRFSIGERVGVAWINACCGQCEFCTSGRENLCPNFEATGRDKNGGYAEYMSVNENFAYRIPAEFSDAEAAPLLCAGAIGYRSLKLTGLKDGETLGLSGFGASGHLVLKLTRFLYPNSDIFVFARSAQEREFAVELGARWAGPVDGTPPEKANAIIDTTPAWRPVVNAMRYLKPGGRLVINAIRKEAGDQQALVDINYHDHLWMEKEIKSVANITRTDVEEFLRIASQIPIRPELELYPMERANEALIDLKTKHIRGAKVLTFSTSREVQPS